MAKGHGDGKRRHYDNVASLVNVTGVIVVATLAVAMPFRHALSPCSPRYAQLKGDIHVPDT